MWWQNLTDFQQITFVVAASATVLLLIFLILMLLGVDNDSFDGDVDDISGGVDSFNDEPISAFTGLRILTLRGALTFLSIGGWLAYMVQPDLGSLWALVLGSVVGFIAALLLALAFRWSMRLESDGNLEYKNAIGKNATVYLRVPKERTGFGKIHVYFQERLVEVDAVTDDKEDIKVNSTVEVINIENSTTAVVTKK